MNFKSFRLTHIMIVLFGISLAACTKDEYISGGSIANAKVSSTTYDYLQSNSLQQFDTLLQLIDHAGLKDAINQQGITFFAPDDRAVFSYLNAKTLLAQRVNPNAKYTLDSLFKYDLQTIKDSMKLYIVPQMLTYDKLKNAGEKYETALAGDTVVVSFENTTNEGLGYNSTVSNVPQVTYFTQLWQPLPQPFEAGKIPTTIGVRTLCKTSGIQTTTGVLNVLSSSHTLFFYGTRK